MHTNYKNKHLEHLRNQQIGFTPRVKRVEQAYRAEKLLAELNAEKSYTYEYLCYRITDYRPESFPHARISGEDARHDLTLLVEDLTDSANIPVDAVGERVLTVDELSSMFNVSSKTISRWRRHGLVSRRFVFDGRKRVGFLQSSVDHFVRRNEERVRRGSQFSQMTDEERDEIIQRARRMALAGGCPAEVAKRLARRTGRSVETIRYTIRQFDEQFPELAVFPDTSGPLREQSKRMIYEQYKRGVPVEKLASRNCRNKTSIYRVINEVREDLLELPLDYMPSDEFNRPGAEKKILAKGPATDENARPARRPSGLPPYLASLYEIPLFTREQEQHIFRRYNYLKYRARKLRDKLDPATAKASTMDRIEKFYRMAVATKNQIVRANLRLVVSIAKRHVGQAENFFELVSDGNISLMRAVEKFDYLRGNKFSTYASWAIMKNFARTIPSELKHRDRFRTSQEETFLGAPEYRADHYEAESAQLQREDQVGKILRRLDDREQQIIISRYGLGRGREPKTLKQVGQDMGVTKERIRQIEARALNKLRLAVDDEKIDAPG